MQRNGTISALLHRSRHTFAEIEEKSQFCRKSTNNCFSFFTWTTLTPLLDLSFDIEREDLPANFTFHSDTYLKLSTSIISNSHPSMFDGPWLALKRVPKPHSGILTVEQIRHRISVAITALQNAFGNPEGFCTTHWCGWDSKKKVYCAIIDNLLHFTSQLKTLKSVMQIRLPPLF